jgi:hypothetical protein
VCSVFYRRPVCSVSMARRCALYVIEGQCAQYLWRVSVPCFVLNIYGGSVCTVFYRKPVCSIFIAVQYALYFIEGQCAQYL